VGKKRWLKLVPAGSISDVKQDPNYIGTFLLDEAHREGTWEYLWLEGGTLQIHHFTAEDTGTSPRGSPNYFGSGVGVPVGQEAPVQQNVQGQQDYWQPKKRKTSSGSQVSRASLPRSSAPEWANPPQGMATLQGVWTIIYEGGQEGMPYTISASGEVTVGKKRRLMLALAGSPSDTRGDPNYAYEGVYLLDNAHREDTWEYMWMEFGRLRIHHFTMYDTAISPFGSANYWGAGMGMPAQDSPGGGPWGGSFSGPCGFAGGFSGGFAGGFAGGFGGSPAGNFRSNSTSYWRQNFQGAKKANSNGTAAWGSSHVWGTGAGAMPAVPPSNPLTDFEGAWNVVYEGGGDSGMTYTISASGEVRVGKKRKTWMVPAGSQHDVRSDANYAGAYFLNDVHREGTWEYVWLEDGILRLHHFTAEDTKLSPLGSSNYFGSGEGTRREPAA